MAEGLLLILEDEECLLRDEYQGLDKVYEFQLLLGIETDSWDVLGKVMKVEPLTNFHLANVDAVLRKFTGEVELPYPAYSSKTIAGQSLYTLARKGELATENLPKKLVSIYSLEKLSTNNIQGDVLLELVHKRINSVTGDFRQEEINISWSDQMVPYTNVEFPAITLRTHVQSGTYIRSLCVKIAQELNTVGLALHIQRTKVGSFNLADALQIEM